MTIDEKLFTIKYKPDTESHLKPDNEKCKICESRCCTVVCPAKVYEWNEGEERLTVNYENCLECGACRICCEHKCIGWEYPKGNKGVTFKNG